MDNEEILATFEEWLRMQPLLAFVSVPRALAILREFADAIEPVPLAEATLKEFRIFEGDHKARTAGASSLTRTKRAMEELHHTEVKSVIMCFREFRAMLRKK